MTSRTKNTMLNMLAAFGGQAFALLISYIARIFFVRYLSSEYLGISGLFSNILSVLSLVELGVGPAMVYSLYKPLAERDTDKIKSLMRLYQKAYLLIGVVILALGTLLTPFIGLFMQEVPAIAHLHLIYWMFVCNSAISYFFSYKRSLIIADQNRYIATIYRYIFYFLLNIGQIVVLVSTGNYLLFLSLQIMCTFAENVLISRKADRMYPYLRQKESTPLDQDTVGSIKRNVGAMIFHKIGTIVVCSTDNLLISKMVGVVSVGIYSNYQLILNALNTVVGQMTNAVVASVGNLGASEDRAHLETMFYRINFGIFWIYAFFAIVLSGVLQPFLAISFGRQLLFSKSVVAVLLFNFYLSGMRRSVLIFRDALGLYWYDRYKPLAEAVVNLVVSIFLGLWIGTLGVFLGTAISTLSVCFWVEPYVLYKYGFHGPLHKYFQRYAVYTLVTFFALAATQFVCHFVTEDTGGAFLVRLLVCVTVPNLVFLFFFQRTDEFQYFRSLCMTMIHSIWNKLRHNRSE